MPKPAVRSNSENGGPGGRSPPTDVTFRIQPRPRSRIAGIANWLRCNGPRTCISIISRTRRSGNPSSGRRKVTAALLTRMSGAPTALTTSAKSLSRSSALGQIRLNRDGPTTGGDDLVAGLAQRSLVLGIGIHRAGGQRHRGTLPRQPSGDRLAQASAASGDERHHPVAPSVSAHRTDLLRTRTWKWLLQSRECHYRRPEVWHAVSSA